MTSLPDFASWTAQALGYHIYDLRYRIVACEARLEAPSAPRQRTIKLVRGTVLTIGGIFGASLEPLAVILTVLGFWDWIEAIREDVHAMNEQIHLRHELAALNAEIEAADAELERRIASERSP